MMNFFRPFLICILLHLPFGLFANHFFQAGVTDTTGKMSSVFTVVENMYRRFAEERKVPGLAFGIVMDGKLVYANAFGFGDTEKKIPVTTKSVYRIASMSKSFIAMAILKLRDAGKLSLDDAVEKYIPEMTNTKKITEDSPPVTIRNLLTHTAGFPEDNPWGDRQLERTDEEFVAFLKKGISLSSVPGLNYEYSNLGFAMLGLIVSRVSGEHYETYIRNNIWKPLDMKDTYWEYADVPAQQLVHGYRVENGKWVKQPMLHGGAYGAMGGMLTSIEDFAKYMALHIAAWPPGKEDSGIIRKSTLRQMHLPGVVAGINMQAKDVRGNICPAIQSYNDGLRYIKDCNNREIIGHSGGLPGFGSNWNFLPQYGIGVVAFCNLTYAGPSQLNNYIVDTIIAMLGLKPYPVKTSAILEQRKEQLVKLLPHWNNAESSGIFAENFFSDYFIDSLRKDARSLFSKAGKIISTGKMIPENELRGSFIIEGEKINMKVSFTLSPERSPLIQEYHIAEILKEK